MHKVYRFDKYEKERVKKGEIPKGKGLESEGDNGVTVLLVHAL